MRSHNIGHLMLQHPNASIGVWRLQETSAHNHGQTDSLHEYALGVQSLLGNSLVSIVLFDSLVGLGIGQQKDALLIIVSDAGAAQTQLLLTQYGHSSRVLLGSTSVDVETFSRFERAVDLGDPLVVHVCRNGEALLDPAGVFERLKAKCQTGGPNLANDAIARSLRAKSALHLGRSAAMLNRAVVELYAATVLGAKYLDAYDSREPLQFSDLGPLDWQSVRDTLVRHGLSKRDLKLVEELHTLLPSTAGGAPLDSSGIDLHAMIQRIQAILHSLAPAAAPSTSAHADSEGKAAQ